MNKNPLSVVIPREALVAFVQKEGGRVPSLPQRGGWGSKYFLEEGGSGTSPLFLEGRVPWGAKRGGSRTRHMGGGPHFAHDGVSPSLFLDRVPPPLRVLVPGGPFSRGSTRSRGCGGAAGGGWGPVLRRTGGEGVPPSWFGEGG